MAKQNTRVEGIDRYPPFLFMPEVSDISGLKRLMCMEYKQTPYEFYKKEETKKMNGYEEYLFVFRDEDGMDFRIARNKETAKGMLREWFCQKAYINVTELEATMEYGEETDRFQAKSELEALEDLCVFWINEKAGWRYELEKDHAYIKEGKDRYMALIISLNGLWEADVCLKNHILVWTGNETLRWKSNILCALEREAYRMLNDHIPEYSAEQIIQMAEHGYEDEKVVMFEQYVEVKPSGFTAMIINWQEEVNKWRERSFSTSIRTA